MIITHVIVSCHVGGAACKEEVHLSLETHSKVDGGVCIGDETINILLLYKLTAFRSSAQSY